MSIIGHSIQANIANVHAGMKDQVAGQLAQADEDAKRKERIRRESEIAREGVRETDATRSSRTEMPEAVRRRRKRNERPPERDDDARDHLDLFA